MRVLLFLLLPVLAPRIVHGGKSAKTHEIPSHPHAAYPRPFSRPASQGAKYNTWASAKGPDVGEQTPDPLRLPSRVDNSTRKEYPDIYKQKWGACGQFASVASIFTYEMNVLNRASGDSDEHRFPAHFSWNMMNRADNNGSEAYHGWEVAKRVGIPTAKTYGGVRLDELGLWPNGYAIWREAMEYRVRGYRYTPAVSVEQLQEAKGWLFDHNQPGQPGGLLAMDGRMGKPPERTFTIPEGQYEAGKMVWTRWNPSGNGHGMACVGYDDQVGYDVNGDGKITNDIDTNGDGEVNLADWERGAYIVANSWGRKWSAEGRIYLLYSAMIDPTWERGNYLGRVEVCRYLPRATLRMRISCNERSNLRTLVGISSDVDAKTDEHEMAPEFLNGWPMFNGSGPGAVPLPGPGKSGPIEVGVDISELLSKPDASKEKKARLFLDFRRAKKSKAVGKVHECSVRFYDEKGELREEVELDVGNGDFGSKAIKISGMIPLS